MEYRLHSSPQANNTMHSSSRHKGYSSCPLCLCMGVHVYIVVMYVYVQVFEAERTGCSDRFAAKRMTMNDSDLIDKQEEVCVYTQYA